MGKDEVRSYLLLCSPHVHSKSLMALYTSVCVVCWNTLTLALNGAGNDSFRMPHSQKFNDATKDKAAQALGLAQTQTDKMQAIAEKLSSKRIGKVATANFFNKVLQYDPKKDKRQPVMLAKLEDALVKAPGQLLPSREGTVWGALNAVTYVIDHETGRDRGTALRNAWLGHLASVKRRAFDLAMQIK